MDQCNNSGVINLHISDHQPVYVIKKKLPDKRSKTPFTGRIYINYTYHLLSDCLTNAVKKKFREEKNPNKCWDLMIHFLTYFLDRFCPKKMYHTRINNPAWITHELIILAKDRDIAWQRAISTGDEMHWATARGLRNLANNSVKAAKADYIKIELCNNGNNPRKFWMNIKNVLPDSKTWGYRYC